MSTERSDQYPEVSGEDAGIVPPQGGAKPEWPKKIRTLTANELDRLTIDGVGRFYWDGKLVNYEAQQQQQNRIERPLDLDQHAMELLERTARELDPNSPAPGADSATTPEQADVAVAEAPALAATPADQLAPVAPAAAVAPMATPVVEMRRQEVLAPAIGTPGTTRILLTGWQSIGLIVVLVSFLVAAAGLAASGFVTAHDWGCKTGAIKSSCPLPPAPPKAPPRPDIPA